MKLVSDADVSEVLSMFESDYPFAAAMSEADTVHLHIKVDDTAQLPRTQILATRTKPESEQNGYVKLSYAGGINMIFSSINVAIEDLIPEAPKSKKPFLDHVGVDLRSETSAVRSLFDKSPLLAKQLGLPQEQHAVDKAPTVSKLTRVSALKPDRLRTVHVAAALSAGVDLIHGVQMQNALRAKHAIE